MIKPAMLGVVLNITTQWEITVKKEFNLDLIKAVGIEI